jgi:hypothetical protein
MGVLGLAFDAAAAGTLINAGLDQTPQGPIERAVSHVSKLGM